MRSWRVFSAWLVACMVAIVCVSRALVANADLASPYPYTVTQPDGSKVTLFIRGRPQFNWQEDPEGFVVVREPGTNGKKGRYVYGKTDPATNTVVPTTLEVGKVNPRAQGLKPKDLPSQTGPKTRRDLAWEASNALGKRRSAARRAVTKGPVQNLVVMVRWADHTARVLPSAGDLGVLFNNNGPHATLAPTGSVRDVYLQNTYNQLNVTSELTDWITVSQTETQAAANASGMVSTIWTGLREALTKADATIDFTKFDNDKDGYIDMVTFIHSGYAAEWGGADAYGTDYKSRIWSHKWALTTWTSAEAVKVSTYHISPAIWGTSGAAIGRIGVISHEMGHFLGITDLYDSDSGVGEGIGSWGLMANSWGFDNTQKYPPHLSAWSKIQLGYVTPTIIDKSGVYTALASETNAQVFKISKGYPASEYLLIENRQPINFDAKMGAGGLAIFHIDDLHDYNTQGWPSQAGWPENGNHYRVALLQADGLYQLESSTQRGDNADLYRVGGKTVLSPTTIPNTKAYQNGKIMDTGITITVLSNAATAGGSMTFRVDFANCTDGIQNQNETGIDCGGVCGGTCNCGNQAPLLGVTCALPSYLNTAQLCTGTNASVAGSCSVSTCCASTTCGVQASKTPFTCAQKPGTALNSAKNCVPGSTCTADFCCSPVCAVNGAGTTCDDGDPNTTNDVCTSAGACAGTPTYSKCGTTVTSCPTNGYVVDASRTCTIGYNCTMAACCMQATCSNQAASFGGCGANPLLGEKTCTPNVNCTSTACCLRPCADAASVGSTCDDSDPITFDDRCTSALTCVGTRPSCANQISNYGPCALDQEVNSTKLCTPGVDCILTNCCLDFCQIPANKNAPCDDRDPSTIGDMCQGGTCVPGTKATCANQQASSGITCGTGTVLVGSRFCTPGFNCTSGVCCAPFCSQNPVGTACDDTNESTFADKCLSTGVCAGTQPTCGNTGSASVTCGDGFSLQSATKCTPGSTCNSSTCCQPATCAAANVSCAAIPGTVLISKQSCAGTTCAPYTCCMPTVRTRSVAIATISPQNKKYSFQATVTIETGNGDLLSGLYKVTGDFTANGFSQLGASVTLSKAANFVTIATTTTWSAQNAMPATPKFCVTSIEISGYIFLPTAKDCSV